MALDLPREANFLLWVIILYRIENVVPARILPQDFLQVLITMSTDKNHGLRRVETHALKGGNRTTADHE